MLDDFWSHPVLGNTPRAWGIALVAFLLTFTLLPLLKSLILALASPIDGRRQTAGH